MNEEMRLLMMCAVMTCGLGLYLWLAVGRGVFRAWRDRRAVRRLVA